MPRPLLTRCCEVCGASFESRKRARYCSKSCIWTATKGPEFNAALAREHNPPRNRAARGTGTKGYVKRDGRHEHRLVVEERLGRRLGPAEVVHHIDRDPHNNALSNLQVLTRRQHMREHGIGIPGMKLWWKPWEHRGVK